MKLTYLEPTKDFIAYDTDWLIKQCQVLCEHIHKTGGLNWCEIEVRLVILGLVE